MKVTITLTDKGHLLIRWGVDQQIALATEYHHYNSDHTEGVVRPAEEDNVVPVPILP